MRALDYYCGGGGVAQGLMQAGFEVVGVDIEPHPNYPGDFILGDVFDVGMDHSDFGLIWASPPCQAFSVARNPNAVTAPPNLIPATRELLSGHPYTIIENVPQAPIRKDLVLTAPMFGLNRIVRKRYFELSWFVWQPQPILHRRPVHIQPHEYIVITKSLAHKDHWYRRKAAGLPGEVPVKEACEAMGINIPMTRSEVGEAIPPVQAQYIAERALEAMEK